MQIIRRQVPNNFNIFCIGDTHTGSTMHYREGWDEMIDMVRSPYRGVKHNVVVDHGDLIEAIAVDDKRFHLDTTDPDLATPLRQSQEAKDMRAPIQKQLAVVLEGNHERKLWKFGNLAQFTAQELGVPFGTYQCRIVYHDRKGEVLFKHFAGHGWTVTKSVADDPVRRRANMKLSMKRKLAEKAGDCLLMTMGHSHQLMSLAPVPTLFLTDNGEDEIKQNYTAPRKTAGYIEPNHRFYGNTGSFLKLYGEMGVSGYAEVAGYDPVELGFLVARVRDRQLVALDKVTL